MKKSLLFCTTCAATALFAYNYPYYEVTTALVGGLDVTNEIADVSVKVTASEGADPETVPFADLDKSAGNFKGTFFKKGPGFLRSSNAMTNFTGDIVIEEGALMADLPGDLGPFDAKLAPTVTVKNAGTAYFTGSQFHKARFYNRFYLAGDGYKELGAVHSALAQAQNDYMFYAPWNLTADARLGFSTNLRFDFVDFTWYLNDHTLTVTNLMPKNAVDPLGADFWTYSSICNPGAGHIVLDRVQMTSHTATWKGGETNTVTVRNARLGSQAANAYIYWTWNFFGNSEIYAKGSTMTACGKYNSHATFGPVNVDGNLRIRTANSIDVGWTFRGPLGGDGDVYSYQAWLNLCARTNAFAGSLAAVASGTRSSGVYVADPRAIDGRAKSVTLTNASLVVAADVQEYLPGDFRLPTTTFVVPAGTNQYFTASSTSDYVPDEGKTFHARAANLVKKGAGTLVVRGVLDVTGKVDVAAGTLRFPSARPVGTFYSANPGLNYALHEEPTLSWENYLSTGVDAWGSLSRAYLHYTKYLQAGYGSDTQGVASCVYLASHSGSPYWHNYMAVTYEGYVWNRSNETKKFRFAGALVDAWKLYIDNSYLVGLYDGTGMNFANKDLAPGPHHFQLVIWNRQRTDAGGYCPGQNKSWTDAKKGFSICLTDASTTNSADFFVPANGKEDILNLGGDGCWFTRDARDTNDFTDAEWAALKAHEHATFAQLNVAAGATVDLGGCTNAVEKLSGAGTVTNGALTVTGTLAVDSDAGAPTVQGTLAFAPGSTFDLAEADAIRPGQKVVLARATEIVGAPSAPAWAVAQSGSLEAKNGVLSYARPRTGTCVIVR